jgi:hypothetical protein
MATAPEDDSEDIPLDVLLDEPDAAEPEDDVDEPDEPDEPQPATRLTATADTAQVRAIRVRDSERAREADIGFFLLFERLARAFRAGCHSSPVQQPRTTEATS